MGDGLIKHVQILLAKGADLYVRDRHGRTTLEIACQEGYVDIAQVLIAQAPQLIAIAGVRSAIVVAFRHQVVRFPLLNDSFALCFRQEQAVRGAVCHDFPGILELVLERVMMTLVSEDARIAVLEGTVVFCYLHSQEFD